MARNSTVDTLITSGEIFVQSRILSTKIIWPAGEPPYATGYVDIPVIGTPVIYSAATFSETDWTDCTALVQNYTFDQNINNLLDMLTLQVAAEYTSKELDKVFKAMRVIVLQEKYCNTEGVTTDWINKAFCISNGYKYTFDAAQGIQLWTVTASSVLKLANINILGNITGSEVYQPDCIKYGDFTTKYTMVLTGILSDAYEYGIPLYGGGKVTGVSSQSVTASAFTFTSAMVGQLITFVQDEVKYTATISSLTNSHTIVITGTPPVTNDHFYVGSIQPNWTDVPEPRFWANDVPTEPDPIPLTSVGDSIQAVFGEGILRISKNYCTADPGDTDDYTVGLGYAEGTFPTIIGIISRFAHEVLDDLNLPSDIVKDLVTNATTTGSFHIASTTVLNNKPENLTVVVQDTLKMYRATAITVDGSGTTITLADTTAEIVSGTVFNYGYANGALDFVSLLLMNCGFNKTQSTKALYIKTVERPLVIDEEVDILIPPQVYTDDQKITPLTAIENFRDDYAIPPQWLTIADENGQVLLKNVKQILDTISGPNAAVIPVLYLNSPEIDRTDVNIFTKVIAYGNVRQILDLTQDKDEAGDFTTVIIDDVSSENLPTPIEGTGYDFKGSAVRSSPGIFDYAFPLTNLFERGLDATLSGKAKRPWAWLYYITTHYDNWGVAAKRLWYGAVLGEITFENPQTIDSIELDVTNTWWIDQDDWGGDRHGMNYENAKITDPNSKTRRAHADPQSFDIEYFDADLNEWRTLVSNIFCPIESPKILTYNSDQFVTRKATLTNKLRIRCIEPFFARCGTADESYYYCIIGLWLSQLKIYASEKIRGEAEIGVTAPFNTTKWQAVKNRIRTRTFIVDNAADWAVTETLADNIATEHLYTLTRNLAPRVFNIIRPDIFIGDTIRLILPTGEVNVFTADPSEIDYVRVYGLNLSNSTDGALYYTISKTDSVVTIDIYKESAKTTLVATGSGADESTITFTGASLTGSCYINHTKTSTGLFIMPTYLVTGITYSKGQPQQVTCINYLDPYFEE